MTTWAFAAPTVRKIADAAIRRLRFTFKEVPPVARQIDAGYGQRLSDPKNIFSTQKSSAGNPKGVPSRYVRSLIPDRLAALELLH